MGSNDECEGENPRLARVPVDERFIEPLFRGECAVVDGVPDDAQFKRMFHAPVYGTYEFVFESDEFDRVGEGDELPVIDAIVEEVEDER